MVRIVEKMHQGMMAVTDLFLIRRTNIVVFAIGYYTLLLGCMLGATILTLADKIRGR